MVGGVGICWSLEKSMKGTGQRISGRFRFTQHMASSYPLFQAASEYITSCPAAASLSIPSKLRVTFLRLSFCLISYFNDDDDDEWRTGSCTGSTSFSPQTNRALRPPGQGSGIRPAGPNGTHGRKSERSTLVKMKGRLGRNISRLGRDSDSMVPLLFSYFLFVLCVLTNADWNWTQ